MTFNKELKEKLLKQINDSQDELNLLIQKLIQIRSYSGEEKEIVEFIIDKMNEYGFDEALYLSLYLEV